MRESHDILWAFELESSIEKQDLEIAVPEEIKEEPDMVFLEIQENTKPNEDKIEGKKTPSLLKSIKNKSIFVIKYISTSACIFGVLMVAANYSAYWNLAQSIIYAEEMQHTKRSLIESVAAADASEEKQEVVEKVDSFKGLKQDSIEKEEVKNLHDISSLSINTQENIDLGIDITPYENRIIIPKIGKNIPLVDIKQKTVAGVWELNDIFMEELENGVIRYPGSAKPWDDGNSFIFGHSSNFPWMKWDYNDVFSLLDHVVFDDEVIVYYGQEKHTYKIRTKNIIKPGDVSVLKNDTSKWDAQITLMTCWPIGTTLNRLVLTWDLISVE